MTRNEAIIAVLAGLAANPNYHLFIGSMSDRRDDESALVRTAFRLVNEAEQHGAQFHSGGAQ